MAQGCKLMVVEDEALIALDLAMTIEDLGCDVCGPFDRADRAAAACDGVDGAILDVDLRDETVFDVADRLRALGKPFVFHTGRANLTSLHARYGRDVPVLRKPACLAQLEGALAGLIRAGLAGHGALTGGGAMRSAS